MKELLKQLAIEQKALKQQRKTGPYTLERTSYGSIDYSKVPANVMSSWEAARQVQANKLKITAALNLYHEKRGSAYRHNFPQHLKREYGKIIVELNNTVNALEHAKDVLPNSSDR